MTAVERHGKDVVLSVRITDAEAEYIRWRADAAGTTVSEQLREALAGLSPCVVVWPQRFPETG